EIDRPGDACAPRRRDACPRSADWRAAGPRRRRGQDQQVLITMRTRVLVLFGCLVLAAGAVARAERYEQPPARQLFSAFPMTIAGWQGVLQPPFPKSVLDVLRPDDYLTRGYIAPNNFGIGLYIGFWATQRQGDAIHSP